MFDFRHAITLMLDFRFRHAVAATYADVSSAAMFFIIAAAMRL